GKSMMPSQRYAVHVGRDQRVGIRRLLHRNAADERRDSARNLVQTAKHDVLAGSLHAGTLQQITQTSAGKSRSANGSFFPLDAGHLGLLETTSVSGALESVGYAMGFELGQIGEA